MDLQKGGHRRLQIRQDLPADRDVRRRLRQPAEFVSLGPRLPELTVFPKLYACPSGVLRDPVSGLNYGMSDPSAPIAAARTEH
jgi:hypothetical protein